MVSTPYPWLHESQGVAAVSQLVQPTHATGHTVRRKMRLSQTDKVVLGRQLRAREEPPTNQFIRPHDINSSNGAHTLAISIYFSLTMASHPSLHTAQIQPSLPHPPVPPQHTASQSPPPLSDASPSSSNTRQQTPSHIVPDQCPIA